MPALLQAFLRLVALKRLGVLLFVLAATLCATSKASPLEPVQTKTRVWGFDFAEHHSAGLFRAPTGGKHQGNRAALSELASGSLLAAEGLEAGGIRVTQKGLDIATEHLAQFGEHAPNQAMLDRLGSAVGSRVTGADANFYLHEISESTMMGRGMSYEAAHAAAIEKYGVSPFSLYHPEVIQQFPGEFNNAWRAYWGIQ